MNIHFKLILQNLTIDLQNFDTSGLHVPIL